MINQNPPEWFTNKMREIKRGVKDLKRDLRDLEGDMDSGFKLSEYRHIRLYNMFQRMNGYPVTPVPFLNAEAIMNELPPIG